jgi:CheY-like chemotaxis protein
MQLASGPGTPTTVGAGVPVLLVEDDLDNRESIADALQAEGFRVTALATGAEALKMLEDPGCPTLILLDLWMPGPGGRELLAAVALRRDRERFRLIVISADDTVLALATRPRVVDVLRKPFALDRLLAAVRRHA